MMAFLLFLPLLSSQPLLSSHYPFPRGGHLIGVELYLLLYSSLYLSTILNNLQFICSFHSTLFMGSVGSIFLSQFGWHSVFIFHGIVALLWAYLWKFHIVLPEQFQKREQFALGNIKMVEASSSERAHMLNVPWGAFSRHPAVWYVFCYYPVCFLLEMGLQNLRASEPCEPCEPWCKPCESGKPFLRIFFFL